MATYKEIQKWIEENYEKKVQSCHIAHCKELEGIKMRGRAHNRQEPRKKPCPAHLRGPIRIAFRHFGMIPKQ